MLARKAGLLDWDRYSIRWALLAVVCALGIGLLAEHSVKRDMQAGEEADAKVAIVEPA